MKNKEITLRQPQKSDLDLLFQFQLDKEANYLASFISKDPADKVAYFEKYKKKLNDPTINMQTVWIDETIVGSIAKFVMEDDTEITYWIDRIFGEMELRFQLLKTF